MLPELDTGARVIKQASCKLSWPKVKQELCKYRTLRQAWGLSQATITYLVSNVHMNSMFGVWVRA